jgi:hypothetical protein
LRLPLTYDATKSCDPNIETQTPCIHEFYDTRVAYDPTIHRFIILSAVRHPVSQDGINDLIVRRFFAFAISRSEDPRDGFDTYISTENNYSDWPRIATAPGQLVVAHWACKNPDNNDPCGSGDHRTTPLDAIALRPEAYILNLSDLVKKTAVIRNWKLYPYQTDGSSILPVAHRGTTSGYTILAHYRVPEGNNGIELFRFKQPAKWNAIPKLQKADGDIPGGAFTGYGESLTLLNGQLYYAGALQTAGRVANTTPAQYVVRGLRLAVTQLTNGTFAVASCPGSGCLQFTFGLHDGNDPAGALWSYELPSMAVNAAGDMVVVHGRVPIFNLPASVGQEARYRVFYPDNRGLQDGTLLRGGSTVLKLVGCNDTKSVTANYFHTCLPGPFQDFATAAADPDGQSIWVAHAFADKTLGNYKFVNGKVTPYPLRSAPARAGPHASSCAQPASDLLAIS